MNNEFKQVMEGKLDWELLEIITKYNDDYQSKAVEAAKLELKKRNLSIEQIENVKTLIEDNEKQIDDKNKMPLEKIYKIGFFIFFWGIIPLAIAYTYKKDGFKKKYKEAFKCMIYGLITFITILCIGWLYIYFRLAE